MNATWSDLLSYGYRAPEGVALLIKGLVLFCFGACVLAQQRRAGRRLGPRLSGAQVGGVYLIVDSLLPLHMAALRFGLLPWSSYELPAFLLYALIAANSVATFVYWWRVGFAEDAPPWDGAAERRTGRERRRAARLLAEREV